jgi:hypothetical protein
MRKTRKGKKMTRCKFVFDDSPAFEGFAEGTTWNGFDNVRVTPEIAAAIDSYFATQAPQYGFDCIAEMERCSDGLISLGSGFATQIIEIEGEPT